MDGPAHKEAKGEEGPRKMELVMSAITGDLVNRCISFLINRAMSQQEHHLEKKEEEKKMVERLQHLLVRVHMVVEEAEGRYITNSMMLLQLKRLVQSMYRGYHALSTVRSKPNAFPPSLTMSNSFNCFHPCTQSSTSSSSSSSCGDHEDQLESALDSLETMVSNMTEFVLLLGGCDRMFRAPYDTHLYVDHFMFGRHVEKQQVMSILLQDSLPLPPDHDLAPTTVLPIVGASRVGKRTLVAHVCGNERVRSHFTSILHLTITSVESISSAADDLCGHGDLRKRTLFVVEFTSDDVDDETWQKFYSSATRTGGRGSKIIVITRSDELSTRLGTVRPVRLDGLSLQEYSYLFKVLAFGSTNPEEHPRLASAADELAVLMGGSLVTANVCADVFRNNQSVRLWLRVLSRYRSVVANNLSTFSEHPKLLIERNRQVDITKLVSSSPSAALLLMPPHSEEDEHTRGLQKVRFGDLIAGSAALPKEEFELVAWESRIPPYKRYVNVARFSDEVKKKKIPESAGHNTSQPSSNMKRQRTLPRLVE